MEATTNVLGYGMATLVGLLALGALVLAVLLWRRPATRHAEPTRPDRTAARRWLPIGLLAVAGVMVFAPSVLAFLLY